MNIHRRKTIRHLAVGLAGAPLAGCIPSMLTSCTPSTRSTADQGDEKEVRNAELFFSISLAQWSLNRSIFGKTREELTWEQFGKRLRDDPDSLYQGTLDPMDFPVVARQEFGVDAIELVNTFYFSRAEDRDYLSRFKQRCDDEGVRVLLIMCDAEGNLGDTDEAARLLAVQNHHKWIDAAAFLGCHSIRVNAAGSGTADEVKSAAIDGLGRLTAYGKEAGINVIVENHGGYSSDAGWLSAVIEGVDSEYCGTLPDFGNFCVEYGPDGCAQMYDRYRGLEQLMPFAKGVSAKSYAFDQDGNETTIDYQRMLRIVRDAGYTGYIGIEYEGSDLPEPEGIRATANLLKKLGALV